MDPLQLDLAKRLLAEDVSTMKRLRELRKVFKLSLEDAKRVDFAARGIDAEQAQRELAEELEAWLPGSQPPLFPSAPRWIPSWAVRLDGGELNKAGGGRTLYINHFQWSQDAVRFKTPDADHFYSARAGTPAEQVEVGYAKARRDIEEVWGTGRPTYIVPPDFSESDLAPGHWSSPRYRCFAWVSSTSLDNEKDGSHAFLIWWQEGGSCGMEAYDPTVDTPSPIEAIERILKAVPWATIAKDYFV